MFNKKINIFYKGKKIILNMLKCIILNKFNELLSSGMPLCLQSVVVLQPLWSHLSVSARHGFPELEKSSERAENEF